MCAVGSSSSKQHGEMTIFDDCIKFLLEENHNGYQINNNKHLCKTTAKISEVMELLTRL